MMKTALFSWPMRTQDSLLITCLLVIVSGRLLPHPANVSPLLAFAFYLGARFHTAQALLATALGLMFSDILLGLANGYAMFGLWSVFSYSGFLAITWLAGRRTQGSLGVKQLPLLLGCSFGYWIWSNLGVWAFSGMYPISLIGIEKCFALALPFLRNQLIGDMLWFGVITLALSRDFVFVRGQRLIH